MTDLPHPTLIELAAILAEAKDRDHCLQLLEKTGLNSQSAECWADYMPLAFARAAYRFQFSGPYPLDQARDERGLLPLLEDEVYQQAWFWACDCGAMDSITSAQFNTIVRLSPELEFIRAQAGIL